MPGFLLRFHLHPAVMATPQIDEQAVLLKLPSNQFWRLRAKGAKVAVEESLYLGGGEPRRTSQIVLIAEPATDTVQWAIGRVTMQAPGGEECRWRAKSGPTCGRRSSRRPRPRMRSAATASCEQHACGVTSQGARRAGA